MSRPNLRVAAPGEKPAKPKTLAEAIEGGVYLEILIAQRQEIAQSLPDERGPAKAALHRQLSLISKEIEGLQAAAEREGDVDHRATEAEAWDQSAI